MLHARGAEAAVRISVLMRSNDMASAPQDVIVIGAGVVGMATALTLIDRGHRVTVIDGAEGPGLKTSYANGAQLSYAYTDALASPSTLVQLPRLAFGLDPAFRLYARFDPDFLRWGMAFLRNTTPVRFRQNTIEGMVLAFQSRIALHRLAARYGINFLHASPGKLHLLRSTKSMRAARATVDLKRRFGARQRIVDADEALAIEPALADIRSRIAGALFTHDEEVGDPHRFCLQASGAVSSTGRGTLMFGTAVDRIEPGAALPTVVDGAGRRLAADYVVLCAGHCSAGLARGVGARLPIMPMKGYSITAAPGAAPPRVSITDAANRVVFARLGSQIRIAGIADLGSRDTSIEPERLAVLIRSARSALPNAALYDALEMSWAGLRPMTPTSLPITRPIAPRVIANTGHGALGWTHAAGSAQRVADFIEGIVAP